MSTEYELRTQQKAWLYDLMMLAQHIIAAENRKEAPTHLRQLITRYASTMHQEDVAYIQKQVETAIKDMQ